MTALLRSRRCRLPLAVILLLVTQIAFSGQLCRAVMLDMKGDAAAVTHQVNNASDSLLTTEADALPCCDGHLPPPTTCLVPDDGSTAAALVAGGLLLPDLGPPVDARASGDAFRRADIAPSHPVGSAAGPPPRIYIVYHRFLS